MNAHDWEDACLLCIAEIDRLRREIAPGWQDIATAPKDGTRVLLNCAGAILIGRWYDAAEFERFKSAPGWQIFACEDGWYSWAVDDATHWMPLPPAPSAAPKEPA
jgi:hypothetical protein